MSEDPVTPPPPDDLKLSEEREPTVEDLAPLIGMFNNQLTSLNNNVVGGDNLRVVTTGVERIKQIAKIPDQPVQRPVPPVMHSESPHREVPLVVGEEQVQAPVQDTLNLSRYDKKITTVKRRLTRLDNEMQCIKDVVSFDYKSVRYNVETDSFKGTCNNTKTLLNLILKELQSGSKSIIIKKA